MRIVHTTSGGDFDVSSRTFIEDPSTSYNKLLQEAPWLLYEKKANSFLFVSRHSDIKRLFKHPALSSARVAETVKQLPPAMQMAVEPLTSNLSSWVVFLDPPAHTDIRRVITASLSSKMVSAAARDIRELATDLATQCQTGQSTEVMSQMCFPLPAMVIASLLGVQTQDLEAIKSWSADLAAFLGSDFNPSLLPPAQKSLLAMMAKFGELIAAHRAEPRSNLMGALLECQAKTPDFTDQALQANLAGLVFAGHETTTNLIGSALLHLYSRPEVFDALMADRSKVAALIEETLRFDGPVQRVNRIATEEIVIDDVTIPAGQDVYLLLGAANRDPAVFVDPNEFRIDRDQTDHLTFGFGRHICPGAQLAKAEAVAAIDAMLDLGKPSIESYEWRQNLSLRGLSTLNLSWAT